MKKILTLAMLLIATIINAQSNQELITTSGEHFTGANAQLSWSIGEPVIETITNSNNTLTQGFHQTNFTIANVKDFDANFMVTVFPNPTSEIINLKVEKFNKLSYQLFNLNGKLIKQSTLTQKSSIISVSDLAKGTYLLTLLDAETNKIKTYQIIKQ